MGEKMKWLDIQLIYEKCHLNYWTRNVSETLPLLGTPTPSLLINWHCFELPLCVVREWSSFLMAQPLFPVVLFDSMLAVGPITVLISCVWQPCWTSWAWAWCLRLIKAPVQSSAMKSQSEQLFAALNFLYCPNLA